MSTIPSASTALTSSNNNAAAITNIVNAQFLSDASTAIKMAQAQGQYSINMALAPNIGLPYIISVFEAQGYQVSFYSVFNPQGQPAQLFGQFWIDYWNSSLVNNGPVPVRMTIAWGPAPQYYGLDPNASP